MEQPQGNDIVHHHRVEHANESVNPWPRNWRLLTKKQSMSRNLTQTTPTTTRTFLIFKILARARAPQVDGNNSGPRCRRNQEGRGKRTVFPMHGIDVHNQEGAMHFFCPRSFCFCLPMPEKLGPRTSWPARAEKPHRKAMQMVKNIRQRGRHDSKPCSLVHGDLGRQERT